MKQVLFFYLEECPHCKKAIETIEQIKKENGKYNKADIKMVEENLNPELSDKFDYSFVPCFFVDGQKRLEGEECTKDNLIKMLDEVIA